MRLTSFNYCRSPLALLAALVCASAAPLAHTEPVYEFRQPVPTLVVDDGAGPGPLSLSTSAINFGNVATRTSETRQVLVSNDGTGGVSFTADPAVTGAAFAAGATTCASTLATGADCLTEATFSPTTVGDFSGTLTFATDLASSPHAVSLTGTAYNPVSLTAATLPTAKLGRAYSYDFKPLLAVSNEASPDRGLAVWEGSGVLPKGLSFDTETGVLSGTPSAVNSGAGYTVTGTYKNNQGQQVFVIKVGEALLEAVQLAAGYGHTCAVTTAGGLKCWGYDNYGQLGNDTALVSQSAPVDVLGLTSGVASVSTGYSHTCAVTTAGGVKCWGRDFDGQLGNDVTREDKPTPVDVLGLTSGVASIAAGQKHTCVVTTAGGVKCWGFNDSGQTGIGGATSARTTPEAVSGLASGVSRVSAGGYHTCALTTAGGLKCWGHDGYGQLGNDTAESSKYTPVDVLGLTSGVASVSAGGSHTCAVTTSGGVKCWGYDYAGQLGNDAALTDRTTPVDVQGLTSGVVSVSAGYHFTCAVTNVGGVKCWGTDSHGQLGNGAETGNKPTPVDILGPFSGVASVATGEMHACAVTTSGGVKCWGHDGFGQLGNDASLASQYTPVSVVE